MQHALAQVVLLNGFQSNPNKPGVEKLVVCQVQQAWLFKKPTSLSSADVQSNGALANPGRTFLVKGFNRCTCMMTILYACFNDKNILQDSVQLAFAQLLFLETVLGQELPQEVRECLGYF